MRWPIGRRLRARIVAVDDHSVRFEDATLLTSDLRLHSFVVALARIGPPELRRSEQPAVLDAIERRGRQEVERAGPAEIDAVVLEALAFQITGVERDRV